jgi:hypothetical protein
LNAELLSHDSATLTLDRWCAVHQLASPAHIAAERVNGVYQAPTDEQRQLLGVSAMLQYLVGDGERRPSSLPLWRIHFPAPRQGRPEELCGQRAATQIKRLHGSAEGRVGRVEHTVHFRRRPGGYVPVIRLRENVVAADEAHSRRRPSKIVAVPHDLTCKARRSPCVMFIALAVSSMKLMGAFLIDYP